MAALRPCRPSNQIPSSDKEIQMSISASEVVRFVTTMKPVMNEVEIARWVFSMSPEIGSNRGGSAMPPSVGNYTLGMILRDLNGTPWLCTNAGHGAASGWVNEALETAGTTGFVGKLREPVADLTALAAISEADREAGQTREV